MIATGLSLALSVGLAGAEMCSGPIGDRDGICSPPANEQVALQLRIEGVLRTIADYSGAREREERLLNELRSRHAATEELEAWRLALDASESLRRRAETEMSTVAEFVQAAYGIASPNGR